MVDNFFSVKFYFRKNFRIRTKNYFSASLLAFSFFFNTVFRLSFSIFLGIKISVAANLDAQPLRQSINNRNTDAMQATGNFIRFAAKFSASVQSAHYNFKRRFFRLRMNINRNASTIIGNRHLIVS